MFDVTLDATYYWLGLAVVSLAMLGLATDLPTRPPPDAPAAANTVDALAASEYDGTARHPLDADSIRLTPWSLGLRSPGGTSHATFAFGPITPAPPESALAAIARGVPPRERFANASTFATAVERARERASDRARDRGETSDEHSSAWRPAPDALVVRTVNWGDVRVTLVLA
jgi:hypothetical protein